MNTYKKTLFLGIAALAMFALSGANVKPLSSNVEGNGMVSQGVNK